ncbi:MAG: hypothetical protein NWE89_06320 [Candidatus Bathyarchaeota archaeon]|nr:hypothetical protein [Candidatus Bathyarchaeota archaeon]
MRIGTVPSYAQWFAAFLLLGGFLSIIGGIADMVNRLNILYVTLLLPISLLILLLSPYPESVLIERLGWVIGILPYLIICGIFLLIRLNFSSSIDLLLVGWAILLLVNVAFAFNAMEPYYVDIMAIFAKIVIFVGMIKPSFSLLLDDMKMFLIAGNPSVYISEETGGISLIKSRESRSSVLEWISDKATENTDKGIRTILISTYDLISFNDLSARNLIDKLYFVRMVTGGRTIKNIFEENNMLIDDDLNVLDILISDIIDYSNDRKLACDIILYSLSSLIHTHGEKRVYSFLLSNMTPIKTSRVRLYNFFYPETHKEESEKKKFETIVDNVITV